MNAIVEFQGIKKRFAHDILRSSTFTLDVDYQFAAGKCNALLGHNGSGKTTSLKILLGFLNADSGIVHFQGQPMTHTARAQIGFMPETTRLPLHLTAEEVLDLQAQLFMPTVSSRERKERVAAMLDQLGLIPHRKKRIAHLSKGLGRIVSWGVAALHDPTLFVLDEPFSGMDPLQRHKMVDWIAALKPRKSFIICTHEFATIEHLVDVTVIIAQGRVCFQSRVPITETAILKYYG